MHENYKKIYDDIEVPSELQQATAQKMKMLDMKQKKKKPILFLSVATTFIAAAVIILFIFPSSNQEIIKTALKNNTTIEEVSLKNGHLKFELNNELIERDMRFASKSNVKTGTLDDAYAFFDKKISIDSLLEGFTKRKEAVQILYQYQKIQNIRVLSEFEQDTQVLIFEYQRYSADEFISNSMIGKTPLRIEFNDQNEYTASFVIDNIIYTLRSKNMSQSDFITLLYNFILS